jgi:hypothetical protein
MISELLLSIPNNIHFVSRYIKFIQDCNNTNNTNNSNYVEIHHICPKVLFPEYEDLNKFSWNKSVFDITTTFYIIMNLLILNG